MALLNSSCSNPSVARRLETGQSRLLECRLKSWRNFAAILPYLLFAILFAPNCAKGQVFSAEYKLKAAYLFHFLQFTDWPTNAFANEQSPIIVGVLGQDPFGRTLDETMTGETTQNRKVIVRRYPTLKGIEECHLLFISRSEVANWKTILARLKGRSILTVGESENFAINGGMIRFFAENNKIRFRINLEAVEAANLSVSSKLLKLADIIPAEKRQ